MYNATDFTVYCPLVQRNVSDDNAITFSSTNSFYIDKDYEGHFEPDSNEFVMCEALHNHFVNSSDFVTAVNTAENALYAVVDLEERIIADFVATYLQYTIAVLNNVLAS